MTEMWCMKDALSKMFFLIRYKMICFWIIILKITIVSTSFKKFVAIHILGVKIFSFNYKFNYLRNHLNLY